jgi:cytochrome d ubiquinol oxidase subunit II
METFWFVAIAGMVTVYVVLDGFDFGTGIAFLWVARTDEERRMALRAIGPVWNGNEVWLLASGGMIFFAFPKAYAAGFSGFYLALMLVLWLLMFRGIALELRSHFSDPIWHAFWDAAFSVASLLLAVVLGAALGNLLRGVPLSHDGYFFAPLWTTFTPGITSGILDWFTVLLGVTGTVILMVHGSGYLAMKTVGELAQRASDLSRVGSYATVVLVTGTFAAIPFVQPAWRHNYDSHPVGYLLPVLALLALVNLILHQRAQREGMAFAASSLLIAALLGSAAWGLYPNLLLATNDPLYSLTIWNTAASPYGLRVGVWWWSIGISLVAAYMLYVYRSFRGKVSLGKDEEE